MSRILVTGAAGFIGFHCVQALLGQGWQVTGLDAMTDYYDPALKRARLDRIGAAPGWDFVEGRVETPGLLAGLFAERRFDAVIHLAAQAGVRYSIEAPRGYLESNIAGSFELLEAARAHPPKHLLLASTSSAYGANEDMPYRETMRADHQVSFYAATKKAMEAMAHSYAHLYGLPTTSFRFFTVYGPWGRPDMAPYKFTRAMLKGEKIEVYNRGEMMRDFTFVDDLAAALVRLVETPPLVGAPVGAHDSLSPVAPYRLVNLGNGDPVKLGDFIAAIEAATGREAQRELLPMQPGDVKATWADTTLLADLIGPPPRTDITEGVRRFVAWYRDYHGV